jgi:glucose-1-phosphate cytidylyltransferase
VKDITPVSQLPIWENGGYFVLSQEIFDLIPVGGDLVADACLTLAGHGRLYGHKHHGFWRPADTYKERAELDAGYHHGDRPWAVWETDGSDGVSSAALELR